MLGPLFRFELVRLARRGTHLPLRVVLALLLLLGLLATYLRLAPGTSAFGLLFTDTADPRALQGFGEAFLTAFLTVQQAAVLLLTPVYAGGAVAEEKEKGRLDFLLTTTLSAWQVVGGKLAARLVFVLAVLAVGLPVLLFTLLFGGVSGERVLAGFAVNGVTAVAVGAFAVLLSVLRHTLRDVLLWAFGGLAASGLVGLLLGGFTTAHAGAAGSPVTVLWPLFDLWAGDVPANADPTWLWVGVFTAIHLPLAVVCVLVAVAKVRTALPAPAVTPVSVEEPEETQPPLPMLSPLGEPPLPEWYKLPQREAFAPGEVPTAAPDRGFLVPALRLAEDPLEWKERHFGGRLPLLEGQWFAVVRGCGVAAFLFALGMGLFIGLVTALQSGWEVAGVVNGVSRTFLVVAVLAVPFAGLRAATGVTEERAKNTLESLFALPLERSAILWAKWRAAIGRSRRVLGSMAAVLLVATLCGAIHPLGTLAAAAEVIGWTVFCVGLGGWLSVRCQSSVRAALWFVGVMIGVFVGPVLLASLTDLPLDRFSPPVGQFDVTAWMLSGRATDFPEGTLVGESVGGLLVALMCGTAGLFFGWQAVRRFEREGL